MRKEDGSTVPKDTRAAGPIFVRERVVRNRWGSRLLIVAGVVALVLVVLAGMAVVVYLAHRLGTGQRIR